MYKELELNIPPINFNNKKDVIKEIANKTGISSDAICDYKILRRSIDARKYPSYRLKVAISNQPILLNIQQPQLKDVNNSKSVIIIGAGPAGLFAALRLIEHNLKPIIIEKGRCIEERKVDIANIIKQSTINTKSNWCFGEGGAGTFSDGKLYTRSNKRGNITHILETFYVFGINDVEEEYISSLLYDSHPHIGTDNLSRIIKNIRTFIESCGGEYHFNTTMTDILTYNNKVTGIKTSKGEFFCDNLVLATGHSSREIYEIFCKKGWAIESKPFAVGVRIEHSQELINTIQYHSDNYNRLLPAASYQLAVTNKEGGVFSFCMCPGGIIIPASTGEEETVVNGMSNASRKSPFANSGIVVSVNENDIKTKNNDPLCLLRFQEEIEHKAFAGKVQAYGQCLKDFLKGKNSSILHKTSYLGGLVAADLNNILPSFVSKRLKEGFVQFDKKMRGFISDEAMLIGVESRTSSPVRIVRDNETLEHIQIKGLYPCGEGAGYAGGITSSAIDGVNVADKIALIYHQNI
jgi:uncharacterized FAD-dependent dehydrogenase